MALNGMTVPNRLDYTDKDFDAVRARLYNLIASVFPTWTDSSVGGFGNMMVEMMSFVCDVISGYQDEQANQCTLANVTQRKAGIQILEQLGYTLQGQVAATVDVQAHSLGIPSSDGVPVSLNTTIVKTLGASPVKYRVTSVLGHAGAATGMLTYNSATGRHEGTLRCKQALLHTESFTPKTTPNQTHTLARSPYLEVLTSGVTDDPDGLDIIGTDVDGLSSPWRVKQNLLLSGPNDKHIMVRVDQYDKATVVFGDGVNGKIPSSTVTFRYEYGGGASGMVSAGSLQAIEGSFVSYPSSRPASIVVSNALASSGGRDRQTLNAAKLLAPALVRAGDANVIREDFETRAVEAGAGRALCLTSDEDVSIAENSASVYVVSSTGGAPSSSEIATVLEYCTVRYRTLVGFSVSVVAAQFKTVDVTATVYFADGYSPTVVAASIASRLAAWFAPLNSDGTPNENVDFGYYYRGEDETPGDAVLPYSDVYNVVRDTLGVKRVSANVGSFVLNDLQADVVLQDKDFPVLGEVVVINAATGQPV